MVSEPSTPGAYLKNQPDASIVGPGVNVYLKEEKQNKIDILLESILRD